MTKTTLLQIIKWLKENTKNFELHNEPLGETVENLIDLNRIYELIQRQESNVKSGFIKQEQLPMAIWFNIYENHILSNGNKRLAFVLYHWFNELLLYEEYGIEDKKNEEITQLFWDNLKEELKYLEDK